ncbi:zinc dependent phospholipase C family protein [Pedobacter cryophilus]|uniref:S1/P1 Nuclease n=1 Tax=Pedobacter cryophilus TaxID=2571271 RepID=A0A4V5NXC9_9SPHI|nr:zinc dependent phospholipase C family protein [Pedobacter cryophilus]TKB98783.1 S1/P1 Nuclease [Pedobacter cryophilus]
MKSKRIILLLIIPCLLLFSSWGFFAHQRINRLAVFTLPKDLIGFYKSNINYITEHAVDPDKRRYADSLEAPRHYLDADHYGEKPFDIIPKKWNDAVAKLSEDTLNAYGIVPWQIQRTYYKLVKAFENKDSILILKHSADLGHYIADAHVPLHTSENYNGQMTNQVGIHGFWESRLPELFAGDYDYFVGKAKYINNPLDAAWNIVENTFTMLDSTLSIEKRLDKSFPSDRKYTYNERNNKVIKEYSLDYSAAYHKELNGMVERQMRSSILSVGSFWYSAWVDAGQPDMRKLTKKNISAEEKKQVEAEEKLFQNGKALGRPEN